MLALAVLVVFGMAYGKLVWNNRLIKMQEGRDEERWLANEESRQSAQIFEARKSQDIPFGIRAIQSGIQVDGIWLSKDANPIPASLNLGHMRNTSSDGTINQTANPGAPRDSFQIAVRSLSSWGTITLRENESPTTVKGRRGKPTDVQIERGSRPSYKPRRSSHLRYDSHREISPNKEALEQSQGKVRKEAESGRHEAVIEPEMEDDVFYGAVADNERLSGSDTYATLSSNTEERMHRQCQSLPAETSDRKSLLEVANVASGRKPRSSSPTQSSNTEYLPVFLEPSDYENLDPPTASTSVVPDSASRFNPIYARSAYELTTSGESQVPRLSHHWSPSPFIPGGLHMNQSVRKVNSCFEILPAGTFDDASQFKGKEIDLDDRGGKKRPSNKLQKKIEIFRRLIW